MQHKETLSAYMDGHNTNGKFTDVLCNSDELQQTWANYHTIRSVMRGEEQILGQDFSNKLAQLLEMEEIENAKPAKKGLLLKLKNWTTPIMQAGIAASVCLVAVLGVNLMNGQSNEQTAQVSEPVLQTLPFSNSIQQVSYNAPATEQPTEEQLEYQQRRINALLQNHELQKRTNTDSPLVIKNEKENMASQKSD